MFFRRIGGDCASSATYVAGKEKMDQNRLIQDKEEFRKKSHRSANNLRVKETPMSKLATEGCRHGRGRLSCASAVFVGALALFGPAVGAENESIPNFAPDSVTGWLKPPGDEFIPPDSGPGPVQSDPAHPYVSNAVARQETVKIADLTNPILKPWVIEQMKKANDEVIAGKVGFTARSRCWPHGVPGFLLYPVHPIFFIQTPKEVVMSWGQDFQMRRVYLNVPHSTDPKPSWYGEVGRSLRKWRYAGRRYDRDERQNLYR